MAAGQHCVSRKRHFNSCREENPPFSRNRYSQKTLTGDHDLGGPVYRVSATVIHSSCRSDIQGKKNIFSASYFSRRHGAVYGGSRPVDGYKPESQVRDKEFPMSEGGERVISEKKKRKISPIVLDRDDRQVRISTKNRIVPAASVFVQSSVFKFDIQSTDLLSDVSSGRGSAAFQEDEDVHMSPPVELPLETKSDGAGKKISPAYVSTAFSSKKCSYNDQEHEPMEDGEYAEEKNVSKSKWAYLDSPSTSLESGEFNCEASEGSTEKSFGSAEAGHFIGSESGDEQSESEMKINDDMEISSDLSMGLSSVDEEDSGRIEDSEGPKHKRVDMFQGCRSVYRYDRVNKISEGTYGVVYKARDTETGEIVALKKVKMDKEREGFPVSALREINILMSLQHPSIVGFKEVVADDYDGVFMVMEYVDHELKGLMEAMKQPFSQSDVKCLMIQLLEGLSFLHENWVIHRDLKTSNLLVSSKGELKICDFGLSRQYGRPLKPYTSLVVTLWYRAPELLLGTKQYSTAIDMWSVGCIMAELLSKKPLFDGNKELEQINKIFGTLGTPDNTIWPGYSSLPGIKGIIAKQPFNHLRKKFPAATFMGAPGLTESGFDLLTRLLTYDPEKRITAEEALDHAWFREASCLFALLLNLIIEILGYRICGSQVEC